MPHPALLQRLQGYRQHLIAVHRSGAGMSDTSKGNEREAFVHDFLGATFPTSFRFGTGDCIDKTGRQSGQLDVVVEYPFLPSFTLGGHSRLYLTEGVAAVIEVKSDVSSQWAQACTTGRNLKALQRQFVIGMSMSTNPVPVEIPYFVVGYTGWKDIETVKSNCDHSPSRSSASISASNSAVLRCSLRS